MQIAVLPFIKHELSVDVRRSIRGRSLAERTIDAVVDSEVFDRIVVLSPEASGADRAGVEYVNWSGGCSIFSPEGLVADRRFNDDDLVAVIGGVAPFVTARLLRGMTDFFGRGEGACVTVRRMSQPHPVNAYELYRWLATVGCDRRELSRGVVVSSPKAVELLASGGEIVLRISGNDETYEVLFEERHRIRMAGGTFDCRAEGRCSSGATVSRSPAGDLTVRADSPPAALLLIDLLSEEGEADCEIPLIAQDLWSFNARSSIRTNRLTGDPIQGRQQYPALSCVEPLVVMGRRADLRGYCARYESGRVRGYPLDAPSGGKAMDFFTWRRFAADPAVDLDALSPVEEACLE